MPSFIEKLKSYNNAAYPALWIQTFEEARITKEIVAGMDRRPAGEDLGCKVLQWDCLEGLSNQSGARPHVYPHTEDPIKLFEQIKAIANAERGETIFILKDFHLTFAKPLKTAEYIRAFKNTLPVMKLRRGMILFVATNTKIPNELTKDIQYLDYKLPDTETIAEKFEDILSAANDGKKGSDRLEVEPEIKEAAIEAAKGMTEAEVENAFALAIVENKAFNAGYVKSVFSEKIQQLKKGGMLTSIETDISFSNVGGLDGIKKWVQTRKNAFSKEARAYNLPYPKGMGLAGIAGCGKTLISKAIANEFKFPLFQLDLGSLFSKYVGDTESNFILLTKTIDSMGRCVLLIDEIEKYLNRGATSGAGDSGTSSRSFGTLLSWLSDRNNPAFVIFTSNDHLALPVELVRKGRFDELFWIDLPDARERKDVINVVLTKYKRKPADFQIDELVTRSENMTGAEIDNAFKDAMFAAFAEGKEVDQKFFVKELQDLVPQATINADSLENMRSKIAGKLRPAALNTSTTSYLSTARKVKT